MALYSFVKKKVKPKRKIITAVSYTSLIAGSLFLFWSFYPVVSFEIYSQLFLKNKVFTPIAKDSASSIDNAGAVLGNSNVFSTNLVDYTQAGIWFPTVKQEINNKVTIKEYTLSIPKLGIDKARVLVGGEDLKKGLVQYINHILTLPGESGNAAIFGHSTLSQLYNVHDYKTIFTYLPSLQSGDTIYIQLADITYEYEVFDNFIVTPEDTWVLDQKYDDSYLTLVTCVPPGTVWKRGVIRARLKRL